MHSTNYLSKENEFLASSKCFIQMWSRKDVSSDFSFKRTELVHLMANKNNNFIINIYVFKNDKPIIHFPVRFVLLFKVLEIK